VATFTKRANGRWQAKIRRRGLPPVSKTFRTKAEATAWASVQESEYERGVWKDRTVAENTTLQMILEQYARDVVPTKRGAAVESYRINTLLRDPLSSSRLAGLTGAVMAKWRDSRLLAGAKGSTVNRELNVLSAAMNWARRDLGIAFENPIADIRRPKNPNPRDRRLHPGEWELIERALSSVDGHELNVDGKHYRVGTRNELMKPVVQIALETAMRRSEIVALRWEDVDLSAATATCPLTKNGKRRVVPLSSVAVTVLRSISRDGPRVFPVTEGAVKLCWRRAIARGRKIYKAECTASGVEEDHRILYDLTFHDLRHEATSRLAERLPNVIELAAVTGHEDLKMLKRYYHPRPSDLAKKLG
jgi:integrase